ncbi:MAG TPA: ATP-binding protein [Candidatus Obscuribacter sp.]|nr:ATP-binding protein [Candidatus Obscuribacter sp.]MBK9277953.1 ATP-binding protein [Candidatus Obscuribacter sp.]MBL8082282.1 ATP-binding protein [Candidatus Obscuribacter sp.]HMW90955.1 ATP-binding protein [Candidatus Obscuribacter sp.]HND04376.1 ATP-binding protein [Candidatus Obscuribacter sp.]
MVRSDSQYSALRGGPRRGSSGGGSGSRGSSGGSSSGRGASGGKRPPPGRGGRGRHDDDEDDFEDDDDDDGESYGLSTPSISGKRMSVTPHASFQNVVAGFYNGLPEKVRELLPWGEEEGESGAEDGPPPDRRGSSSWQEVSFIHSIPGEDEEEGLVVLADGSFRKYISCKGINALLFDEAEREMMARTFANFANSCESDIQIIIKSRNLSVDEYLSRYQILLKTDNDYLKWYADYTDKWFRKVQDVTFVPQRDFYVVISYHPPDCKTGKSWNGRRSIQKHEEYLEILNRLKKTAFEQLRASNLRPQVLTRKDVRNLIYSDLNPSLYQKDPEAPPSRPNMSEASTLAGSALKITDEYVWLDGKYIGTQYMFATPHETWMGWLVDLLTISTEYTLSMFIHQCDQDRVRRELKLKYRMGHVTSTQLATPDLEGLESTRSAAQAIQEFLRSSNKAFDVSLYLTTAADTPEHLAQNMDEIRRVFKNRGAQMDRGQMLQLDLWQSTLSVGVDKLAVVHRVMSPIVGTMWPFFTASCGTPDGVPFGFALASREPVLLNPFFRGQGKDANNMFVVGTTGAGKSFAVSMMMLRLLPLGTRFVLIDKTVDKFGAYRFITELLGPELCAYVDLGPSSGFVLNPFDLGPEDKPGEPSADKVSTLLSLLDLMLAPEGREELSVEEKSLLDGLIRLAYMEASFRNQVPTMTDLAQVTAQAAANEVDPLQRDRLHQFARGLSLFTRSGAFGGLVDGLTNIETEKLFIVFDTREVNEPRLERIAVFILAEFIRRRAADSKARGQRFAAIIDEAATLMRFKAGARLLDDLSRRARHYGMMLVSITQQLKDFFRQAEQADSVVKNSHMKILLRQDPSDLRMLKETLRLTDAETAAIEQFSRDEEKRKDSQCLLIVGAVHGTIRLVPSPMDYWICTSEPIKDIPKRLQMIEDVRRRNPKLSHTDACRQAVYYLGLQHDG